MSKKRLLYVSFSPGGYNPNASINRKDLHKIEALNELPNIDAVLVVFVYGLEQDQHLSDYHILKAVKPRKKWKYFQSFRNSSQMMKALEEYIDHASFDLVFTRYRMATRSLLRLSKRLKERLFFEHNTKEISEFLLRVNESRAQLKFSIKPGYFIYWLEGKILPVMMEKYWGSKVRKNVRSGFSVTHEIGAFQQAICSEYNSCVLGNGIRFKAESIARPVHFDGTEIKMFMLLGTKAVWHGVDRLIKGLSLYDGPTEIKIDIIGAYMPENVALARELKVEKYINFIAPIKPEEMDDKLQGYHLALGTLGLHRKDLHEASPLKVRESLMRGFLVVIGYPDTDFLETNQLSQYVLQFSSDDTPINFHEVVAFAKQRLSDDYTPLKVHSEAKEILSYRVKMKQMVHFMLEQIAD